MKHLFILLLFIAASPLLQARPDMTNRQPSPTPYDPYIQPVNTVLRSLDGTAPDFKKVSTLVKVGFSFKYTFDEPYIATLPKVTAAKHAGDCKAKSLWLASEMNDRSIQYVIGKARRSSKISHAWLMWKNNNRWWILDPTNASAPIPADKVGPDEYLVSYSYDQTGSYRHQTPRTFSRRSVAGRS